MSFIQNSLFQNEPIRPYSSQYPSTRFQGSKRSLIDWIWDNVAGLQFDTVLDVFGGTGVVSYLFKTARKEVTYNDNLAFNWQIGRALIENGTVTLSSDEVENILMARENVSYPKFIQVTFDNIYFTNEENAWLDRIVFNIDHFLDDPIKQALARFSLFQACIIKRPYNLFHRANLYMRNADVQRSFGNKKTWDTPFEKHFRTFVKEANTAVFDNGRTNRAIHVDALETPVGADLVYLDPPYINSKGIGVNYRDFYHFLEGLMNYGDWSSFIDYRSRHRRLIPEPSMWDRADSIITAFDRLISRHRQSIIVISYRDDGIPSKTSLITLLKKYKSHVQEAQFSKKYALAHRSSHELLLIGI